MASRPMLARAWSIRAPPSAPTITTLVGAARGGPPGPRARCPTRPCPAGDRSIGTPAAVERGQRVLADRVAVADPQVDRDAEGRGVAGAAVGRDDEPDAVVPARPGAIEVGRGRDVAVGEDERDHGRDATRSPGADPAGASRPDARLRPCPTPPSIPSIQRVLDAAARKGVTLEVVDLRRVDPHRRRGRRGARRRARPDRQVARLRRSRRGRRPRAGPVPRRRPQPGRPRPARGGHRRARHPPRDRARGARPDRLRDRRHPADRPRSGRCA